MATPLAYLNGTWIPAQDLTIPINDLGFTLGVTLVERLRTFAGQAFRAEEHLQRLHRSLEIVGFDAPLICEEVATAIKDFLKHNGSQIASGDDWNIVCVITPGSSHAGPPTACVHGAPLPFSNWAPQYKNGLDAVVVTTCQIPEECWPPELKCRSRMHYYLADQEAQSIAPGSQAILLDHYGFVGEGSTANVVAYFAERGLVTPPRNKVLPGVSQQVLYELAEAQGIPHSEADMRPEELAEADELFFTSTSICLLPVTTFNGKSIGTGKPGKTFQQLLDAWSKLAGVDIAAQALQFTKRGHGRQS